MDKSLLSSYRIDRNVMVVASLHEEPRDRAYWMAQPPEARWRAIELMRQVNYGIDATSGRLQRVFEIAQLGEG
ncbi:MAG: hypothetical protein NTW19_14580 [Planctomycetota bacterium]|nr:hypothetical protein [Planctomycetota bacterium]